MNHRNHESVSLDLPLAVATTSQPVFLSAELVQLKRELLQAEVRLAKARAAVTGAEVDIKVLNARLKALTK